MLLIRPDRKPRVLIVIAHFDETRRLEGRPHFMPQGVGHAFLAGMLHPERCEVRLYSEFESGPLLDIDLLGWPDMLVLTGVTAAFDRMLHLTAYARTLNPGCVVVAGGPAVRSLPRLSARFFDHACRGDIEELRDVVIDVFGERYAAEDPVPRFDLLNPRSRVGYVESSRYCNFRCAFCSLTGEGRRYRAYDLDYIERQIRAYDPNKYLLFIDNNFFGSNRAAFDAKLALLEEMWRLKRFRGWFAIVTGDLFADASTLARMRRAGCLALFSGVETTDPGELRRYGKKQNLVLAQQAAIERCLETGIVFGYGLLFDPSEHTTARMRAELDGLLSNHRAPLPTFFSLTIPLLGTPIFRDYVAERRLLPNVRLRDMDGATVVTETVDPAADVVAFLRDIKDMSWAKWRVLAHAAGFLRAYGRALSPAQLACIAMNGARLCFPGVNVNNTRLLARHRAPPRRTYLGATEPLGPLYEPLIRVPEHLSGHFAPTMVTNAEGELHEALAEDLSAPPLPIAPRRRDAAVNA